MPTKRYFALKKFPNFDLFLQELTELENKYGYAVLADRIVRKSNGKMDFNQSLYIQRQDGRIDMREW
jgi:hypothetical protein